jgi:hypothetical protein
MKRAPHNAVNYQTTQPQLAKQLPSRQSRCAPRRNSGKTAAARPVISSPPARNLVARRLVVFGVVAHEHISEDRVIASMCLARSSPSRGGCARAPTRRRSTGPRRGPIGQREGLRPRTCPSGKASLAAEQIGRSRRSGERGTGPIGDLAGCAEAPARRAAVQEILGIVHKPSPVPGGR